MPTRERRSTPAPRTIYISGRERERSLNLPAILFGALVATYLVTMAVGIERISAEQATYAQEQTIRFSLVSFQYKECSLDGPQVGIFRETDEGWTEIETQAPNGRACINGEERLQQGGDVLRCRYALPLIGYSTWNTVVYERHGETDRCGATPLDRPIPDYVTAYAPPGKYKAVYGDAETTFAIVQK